MDRLSPAQIAGIAVAILVIVPIIFLGYNPDVFERMTAVVHFNWGFWVYCAIGTLYAFWRLYRNPNEFTLKEMLVQIAVTLGTIWLASHVFFYYGGDLDDIEVWNSYTTRAVYEESYENEVCTNDCDDDGNCTTTCSCSYVPPSWYIETGSEETIGIDGTNFNALVQLFGNKRDIGWNGDIGCNTGRIFETKYIGNGRNPEKLVPTANEHRFVNYLKASDSIRKRSGGNTEGFEQQLANYPRVHGGPYGPIEIDRVIVAGTSVPNEWKKAVDRGLDRILAYLGKKKKSNVLVYIAGTSDAGFLHALEEYWVNGKKNDTIIIIGVTTFPNIDWVRVISWTNVELFKITLRDRIAALETLDGKEAELVSIIAEEVDKPGSRGGFEKMSGDEYVYLASEIEIAWWAHFLLILIGGFVAWLTSWALENNTIQNAFGKVSNTFGRRGW